MTQAIKTIHAASFGMKYRSLNKLRGVICESNQMRAGIDIQKIEQNSMNLLLSSGDPVFFPNTYQYSRQSYFLIDQRDQNLLYKKFSKKIRVIDIDEIKRFSQFILISEHLTKEKFLEKGFVMKSEEPFHESLRLFAHRFRAPRN